MSESPDNQNDPVRIDGADRTGEWAKLSNLFLRGGHAMAGFLIFAFLLMFANSVRQLDFWKDHFFRDTLASGQNCNVIATLTDGKRSPADFGRLATSPLELPHPRQSLLDFAAGDSASSTVHSVYNCQIEVSGLQGEESVAYLHTGWIRARDTRIYVNDSLRVSFLGMDKPAVPITVDDIDGGTVNVSIDLLADANGKAGLVYASPFIISQGTSQNFRVMGVDYALANQKPLYDILPLLALAVILAIGWFVGIRTRALVVTFLFLALHVVRNLLWVFNDSWPWNFAFTRDLSNVLHTASLAAFLIFTQEMFGFARAWIPKVTVGLFVTVATAGALIYWLEPTYATSSTIRGWMKIGLIAVAIITGYRGIRRILNMRRTSRSELATKMLLKVIIALLAFTATALVFDFVAVYFQTSLRLTPYLFKFLPLAVGGVVLYSMYLVEQQLQEEQGRRTKIENELNLAAKLQNILLPDTLKGQTHGFDYRIESIPHGILGGDWVKVHSAGDRALVILGDVVGKGASAALTHSGIAAAWESRIKDWERGLVTAEELLTGINETMFDLFGGEMNTTFAAAEIRQNGQVKVAAGGNYWLHLNQVKSQPVGVGTRSLLGVSEGLTIKFQELTVAPGDWLICFTDGVLEGNRPVKRFLRAVQPDLASMSDEKIRAALIEAGRDEVHPDDASMLLLQYHGKAGESAA